MTESQMQKMPKFPESLVKLGDTVEYVKDGTKKRGVIYSVNSNAKTFDIFCKLENIVDKDYEVADGDYEVVDKDIQADHVRLL